MNFQFFEGQFPMVSLNSPFMAEWRLRPSQGRGPGAPRVPGLHGTGIPRVPGPAPMALSRAPLGHGLARPITHPCGLFFESGINHIFCRKWNKPHHFRSAFWIHFRPTPHKPHHFRNQLFRYSKTIRGDYSRRLSEETIRRRLFEGVVPELGT